MTDQIVTFHEIDCGPLGTHELRITVEITPGTPGSWDEPPCDTEASIMDIQDADSSSPFFSLLHPELQNRLLMTLDDPSEEFISDILSNYDPDDLDPRNDYTPED